VKLVALLAVVCSVLLGTVVHAQAVLALVATPVSEQDKAMLKKADSTLKGLENSLKDYAVALKPRANSDQRHVGLPLASFGNDSLHFAYDLATKSMAAQWRFAQTKVLGQTLNYQAFVGESGTASLQLSTRF
jgi:hypothetical protein